MADATTGTDTKQKKARKPQVRKPVEIAVVVTARDASGNPLPPGTEIEVVHAGKDVAAAFRKFKEMQGSGTSADMVTFTMQPAGQVTAEKAA